MATAFIKKTDSTTYMSAPDYISQFYGDKEGIPETKILSSPLILSTSEYLFSDFTGLEYANFQNLSFLAHKTFFNCSSLKQIELPNASYIGSYAFAGCTSLKYLSLPKCISMGENTFEDCNSLEELYLPLWSVYNPSYSWYCYTINNLPNLKILDIRNRYNAIRLQNLPNLEALVLSNLHSLGTSSSSPYVMEALYSGYFENLPKLSSLTMDKLSILYSRAFISVSNLETLILPECVQIYSNVFTGEIPDNIMTVLPKVKSMHFAGNYPFKSLIFPAPSDGNDLGGFVYMPNYAPEYIEFTNVSVISNTHTIDGIFASYGYTSIINNDTILSFPKLEYTYSNTYRWDTYTKYSNTHVIINAPRLKELCSSAFNNFRILKEINLGQVSILNNDVFIRTACFGRDYSGPMSINGLLLSNTYNVKEVKAGAFHETKLRDNILYLPNCEKFDFRQYGSAGHYRYSLPIYNEDASTTWFSQRIDTIHLPKLSEIIIDANLHYDIYSSFTYIDLMFPQKEMRFEECKRIQFLDGSSEFLFNRYSLSYIESCDTLYIPECSTIEYIFNSSISHVNGISLYFPIHSLYAPKLMNATYIRFLNTYNLNVSFNLLSSICLEYWLGFISNLSISDSFDGLIDIRYYNAGSSKQGSFYLSNINLPNYSGYFYLRPLSNQYSSISSIFDIYLGNNIKYISMSLLYQTSGYKNKTNITILKDILDNNVRIQDNSAFGMPYSSYRDVYYNYPNCSLISYSFSLSMINFYSTNIIGLDPYYLQFDEYDEYCKIWENYGTLNMPNLEKMHIDIVGYKSVSIYYSSYMKYSNINITFDTSILYTPKFSKITISIPDSLRSYFNSDITCTIDFGNRIKSLTLGISDIKDFGAWYYNYSGSNEPYLDYLNLSTITYLSLSNLNGICSMSHRVQTYTLSLQQCTDLYIPNIEYISDYGLYVPRLTSLYFSKVSYIGRKAINGPMLQNISLPNVGYIGYDAFSGCSSLEVLTLPSKCSYIGENGIPSNSSFKVLELQYPGVVDLHSNQWHYFNLTVRVPMAYLESYKNHSIWGSKYSSYWNIVGY